MGRGTFREALRVPSGPIGFPTTPRESLCHSQHGSTKRGPPYSAPLYRPESGRRRSRAQFLRFGLLLTGKSEHPRKSKSNFSGQLRTRVSTSTTCFRHLAFLHFRFSTFSLSLSHTHSLSPSFSLVSRKSNPTIARTNGFLILGQNARQRLFVYIICFFSSLFL